MKLSDRIEEAPHADVAGIVLFAVGFVMTLVAAALELLR